jgi:hypothetical protein
MTYIPIPGNPNVYPAAIRAPNGSDPRNSTTADAGLQDLADRTAHTKSIVDSTTSVLTRGIERIRQVDTIVELKAIDTTEYNVILVRKYGLFILIKGGYQNYVDGVSVIRSDIDSAWTWLSTTHGNIDAGYPIIGPAYPYDGSVSGNPKTPLGRIAADYIPNRLIGVYNVGAYYLDQTFAAGSSGDVTNSRDNLTTRYGVSLKIGDRLSGTISIAIENEAISIPATLIVNSFQGGISDDHKVVLARKQLWQSGYNGTVRPMYISLPFNTVATADGTLVMSLSAEASTANFRIISTDDVVTDGWSGGANWKWGQLYIHRP